MTVFTDTKAGIVDTDADNCARTLTYSAAGKPDVETITTHKGFVFQKTYLYDANSRYSGETPWTAVVV